MAHTCPDCGQYCTCRGDIDDIDIGADYYCIHCMEDDDGDDDDWDEDDGIGMTVELFNDFVEHVRKDPFERGMDLLTRKYKQ